MHLLHLFRWLANSWVANTINDSEWLFPVIESIHITGLAVLIGTIAYRAQHGAKSWQLAFP